MCARDISLAHIYIYISLSQVRMSNEPNTRLSYRDARRFEVFFSGRIRVVFAYFNNECLAQRSMTSHSMKEIKNPALPQFYAILSTCVFERNRVAAARN